MKAPVAPAPDAPVFRTRITELFGIRHPVLGGGLMWLSDARYVAALVNAGAMAFMTPRSYPDLAAFRQALRDCAEQTQGRPFGVNLTQSRRASENAWMHAWIDLALEQGVRHFETVGPSPGALFDRIHARGGIVIHKSAFVEHALKAQEAGADAVALVGTEAGGHPGTNELPAFVLGALALPRLRVPLALGGGIGSGRQLAAALALGADAVLMGTRFLVCDEVWAHDDYKRHLAAQPAEASTLALRSTGNPWRVLHNATVRETRRMESAGANQYADFGTLATGRLGRDRGYAEGDWDTGLLSMGPAVGFADAVEPVHRVMDRLMADAMQGSVRLAALMSAAGA
ncbi:NAD(P)H-dependent flavin oxidoreductase [Variovorax saccharolyticus]|uniref:NAD(P)H-dependent flavin oxidoreductase n=1 Tax=Variovorax saccharolyticus TaxID=3053516 RepID=UPI0025763A59|nr:nitronate monooxygenase [Variovorax sp. J31P216]MDM0025254.1 nitronate monooxygenase [Variovorax sp. J31P216]